MEAPHKSSDNKTLDSSGNNKSTSAALKPPRFIVIGQPNLQSNILKTLIADKLDTPCGIINVSEYRTELKDLCESTLLLIDCPSVPVDTAADILHNLQNQAIDIALINASRDNSYEQLAEWPQLKGIFYANCAHSQLIQGLQQLLNDGHWLPRNVMESLLNRYRRAPKRSPLLDKLTRRERQILQQLLEGATNQDIAATLYVSEHTVKSHLYNVFKKIGVSNRLQACNWAKQYL